ncbi:MAG: hypothetical protein JSV52_11715 [Candidatus Zixiibacteriota bacterium]|nr:MAG: hypothetical protein JSV52_11715 [candidate division Zixibacteria bacterium]
MIRRTFTTLLVSLLVVSFLATFAFAASKAERAKQGAIGSQRPERALAYSFPNERVMRGAQYDMANAPAGKIPIGTVFSAGSGNSPGVVFGNTWYDYQHNCSMGRMIETGPHTGEEGYTVVHMGWMYLPEKAAMGVYRTYAYSAYRSEDHAQLSPEYLQVEGLEYGGYVNVDVTPDNRAIVGGHNNPDPSLNKGTRYSPEFYFDGGPAYATFPNSERIPDSVKLYDQATSVDNCWPKFFFQLGTDTVMHVASQMSEALGLPQAIMYYRKVGFEGSEDSEWDYPPYVVDTVQDIAQDVIGQRNANRVCLVWFAALPYTDVPYVPDCDTCSGVVWPEYDGWLIGQMDNDIYYQESLDQGATWNPRVNMTKCVIGDAQYKAFCDASVLYDSQNNLHIVWHANPWPADICMGEGGWCFTSDWFVKNARLMHWSENVPYIRPIVDQVYAPDPLYYWIDTCRAGAWNLNVSKPSLSECDSKLYTMWVQFNNPKQGINDDCAQWALDNSQGLDREGGANGDLYVSVSEDWGMTWDYQRNLTNTYTPGCDPKWTTDCDSDHWPSMSRTGRAVQTTGDYIEDWTGAVTVDPSGNYTGEYFLDIMYVNDADAGGIVQIEGTWTDNMMKWFRMPCVEPIPLPVFTVNWQRLGDPNYVKPGEYQDTNIIVENIGNTALNYSINVVYDEGTPGWLLLSSYAGSIPSGLAGTEVIDMRLNTGQWTTTGNYYGHMEITGNDPNNLPADVNIELIIADTIVFPSWDSVMTTCVGLLVNNAANVSTGAGILSMDYYRAGDCDTTAKVYLYDAGPYIGWIEGTDTVVQTQIWDPYFTDPAAFRPLVGFFPTKDCAGLDAQVYHTGTVVNQDSTIALKRIYIAPSSGACNFVLEYTKVWSFDGEAHSGLFIGEGADWDIPTDFRVEDTAQEIIVANSGGFDADSNLIYCRGFEAYGLGSDTLYPFNCQDNDDRYGGQAFVASYLNGSFRTDDAYGGFVGLNDSLQSSTGYQPGPFYKEVMVPGWRTTDSVVDLNAQITFEFDFDLGATDVYEAVLVFATVHDGSLDDLLGAVSAGEKWYYDAGGYAIFEDIDEVPGEIDICAGCCKNANFGHFYNHEGEFNILDIDNFIEWLLRDPGGPPIYDCKEQVDVSGATAGVPDESVDILDIDFMISYLLRGTEPDLGSCP